MTSCIEHSFRIYNGSFLFFYFFFARVYIVDNKSHIGDEHRPRDTSDPYCEKIDKRSKLFPVRCAKSSDAKCGRKTPHVPAEQPNEEEDDKSRTKVETIMQVNDVGLQLSTKCNAFIEAVETELGFRHYMS